jgi:hypothetical protein
MFACRQLHSIFESFLSNRSFLIKGFDPLRQLKIISHTLLIISTKMNLDWAVKVFIGAIGLVIVFVLKIFRFSKLVFRGIILFVITGNPILYLVVNTFFDVFAID